MFENVIGQARAKKELQFRLSNHRSTQAPFPNILLTGSKGDGKSHLARNIGKNLPDFSDGSRDYKRFFTINGSNLKSLSVFFEEYCTQFLSDDKHCTIFIDEAHEVKKSVQNALLTVLENTATNRTTFEYNGVPYYFDFHKITFIFATTEDDKIIEPLVDRLLKLSLEPYTSKELGQIMTGVIDGAVKFDRGILDKLSHYVRRNARKADQLAKDVISCGVPKFKKEHLEDLITQTNLFPLGLEAPEVRALRILEEIGADGLSLGQLASRLGRPSRAMQKGVEPYILALGLMEIDGKRRITPKGRDYLREVDGKKPLDKCSNIG